ncbi:hypothetical protein AJ80_06618 [Polytolypa hystricis UAMH7299]|uniref:Uncharacterized protein n=1 Tax=Polytolypa hystricis (strain UAMH7299) TaxID=1447883 RepID=A0A2B7XUQ3_POLH7|nr:hypothetical protein AJ80_06618 [Polytolypa hystricis UAMH7299]
MSTWMGSPAVAYISDPSQPGNRRRDNLKRLTSDTSNSMLTCISILREDVESCSYSIATLSNVFQYLDMKLVIQKPTVGFACQRLGANPKNQSAISSSLQENAIPISATTTLDMHKRQPWIQGVTATNGAFRVNWPHGGAPQRFGENEISGRGQQTIALRLVFLKALLDSSTSSPVWPARSISFTLLNAPSLRTSDPFNFQIPPLTPTLTVPRFSRSKPLPRAYLLATYSLKPFLLASSVDRPDVPTLMRVSDAADLPGFSVLPSSSNGLLSDY